jgi:aryl-alcohol dehydrogenase-like predicted oxidoreductase
MAPRALGETGLVVSPVGLGCGPLGEDRVDEGAAERLVRAALDAGVTLFDTARSYGSSEARLGRLLGRDRRGVVLSTKLGYGVDGVADWTGPCVTAGVDGALRRLATDWLDVVHLHSCPREVLERGEVVEALAAAVAAGKVRVAGYAGDNDAADHAVACGRFAALETSLSLIDRRAAPCVARAAAAGLGVIAKRPLGNAPWRFAAPPPAADLAEAHRRFVAVAAAGGAAARAAADLDWAELAVRFTVHHAGVTAAIVGTARPEHLRACLAAAASGPLPEAVLGELDAAYAAVGRDWPGVV